MLEALGHGVLPGVVAPPPPPPHASAFRELLSELNPLQYLPVIGTIYRAVTGDTIPETARTVGSLVMSGLTGGPIGVAIGVAALALERVTGLDPERIGGAVLADLGIGGSGREVAVAGDAGAAAPGGGRKGEIGELSPPAAWSAAQLRSYGVVAAVDGTLTRTAAGERLTGADVLNEMELKRLQGGSAAV